MFGWIRSSIDDIRFKQALLKGNRCPECHSVDVGWDSKPQDRHCKACGFQWEQDGGPNGGVIEGGEG